MIHTLRMKNYRSFDEYELRELARVNLLVGPNNCGKTSVLEAVHLLALGGDPRALAESARRRGESSAEIDLTRKYIQYSLHHQFHGHAFDLGTSLSVSSDDDLGQVRMEVVAGDVDESQDTWEGSINTPPILALRIHGKAYKRDVRIPLAEDGSPTISLHHPRLRPRRQPPPTQFVTAESLRTHEMAGVWNRVEVGRRESEVIETMRILQEDLDSIRFLPRNGGTSPEIVVGFRSGSMRIPIGSYGDGMRRLLAISLSLVHAEKGFLLIDEIDTGLHWSVMEEMWKLVVEAAVKSSIQVFATTHSLDCIVGLASLLKTQPNLRDVTTIQKIERKIDHSVSFDGESIVTATDLNVELR